MTDQKHPITPPTELLEQWEEDIELKGHSQFDHVLNCVWQNGVQAGADAELEACKKVILDQGWFISPWFRLDQLHNARRPKLSLKERALARTDAILNDPNCALLVEVRETLEMNRRALEQLPDDQRTLMPEFLNSLPTNHPQRNSKMRFFPEIEYYESGALKSIAIPVGFMLILLVLFVLAVIIF